MKIVQIKKALQKFLGEDWEYSYNDDGDVCNATMTIALTDLNIEYEGTALLNIAVHETGVSYFHIFFDHLEESNVAYKLLNELNAGLAFFKAYSEDYLTLCFQDMIYAPEQLETFYSLGWQYISDLDEDNLDILSELVGMTDDE